MEALLNINTEHYGNQDHQQVVPFGVLVEQDFPKTGLLMIEQVCTVDFHTEPFPGTLVCLFGIQPARGIIHRKLVL